MSEAPCSTAWAMIPLTSLMIGASSADSRSSTTSAPLSSSSSKLADCDDVVQARQARDEAR